ncbi:MAG: hypothetical protein BM485_09075 [Desulfobulbaceae bacterium DB1]|nr:MAG: hypothetical protein BM485_09075 [Desulfobulbaceae bacterium DB1]
MPAEIRHLEEETMGTFLRQFVFLFVGIVLRWPLWLVIGILGRFGFCRMIFLVYPTDELECSAFCPNIKLLRRFFSGRPTPGGLIMQGFFPLGFYLVIPDLPEELAGKKNRELAQAIVRRLLWIRRLAGAQTIGLAGRLGPIFSRRHNIDMAPPLFSSINGNIFSIHEAIRRVSSARCISRMGAKIAIIGGGEMGLGLQQFLEKSGSRCRTVNVRFSRSGKIYPLVEEESRASLAEADLIVNLLPRGEDFLHGDFHRIASPQAAVIDFSRPAVEQSRVRQQLYFGNRLQRPGSRFMPALPGGWQQQQLPACSLPAMLAMLSGQVCEELEVFCRLARSYCFESSLADLTPAHAVSLHEVPEFSAGGEAVGGFE